MSGGGLQFLLCCSAALAVQHPAEPKPVLQPSSQAPPGSLTQMIQRNNDGSIIRSVTSPSNLTVPPQPTAPANPTPEATELVFSVSEVEPAGGPGRGGTTVTLRGKGLGVFRWCLFDINAAASPVISRSKEGDSIKCVAPAQSEFAPDPNVLLKLSVDGEGWESTDHKFLYYNPTKMKLKSLSPTCVSREGGAVIIFAGKGFDVLGDSKSAMCAWQRTSTDDAPELVSAKTTTLTDTRGTCIMPQVAVGDWKFALSVNGVDFLTSDLLVHVAPAPRVVKVEPTQGAVEGAENVSFIGKNFLGCRNYYKLNCSFDDSRVVAPVEVTDGEVVCVSPPSRDGEQTVNVSLIITPTLELTATDLALPLKYQYAHPTLPPTTSTPTLAPTISTAAPTATPGIIEAPKKAEESPTPVESPPPLVKIPRVMVGSPLPLQPPMATSLPSARYRNDPTIVAHSRLLLPAIQGHKILKVESHEGFKLESNVTINPGQPTEESVTVVGFGSLVLSNSTSVKFNHLAGEEVVQYQWQVTAPKKAAVQANREDEDITPPKSASWWEKTQYAILKSIRQLSTSVSFPLLVIGGACCLFAIMFLQNFLSGRRGMDSVPYAKRAAQTKSAGKPYKFTADQTGY